MRSSRVLPVLYAGMGLQGAGVGLSGLALPFLIDRYRVDKGVGGGIPATAAFGFAVGSIVGGRLADRWGRASVMRLGLVLMAVANLGLAAAPLYSLAIGVSGLSGIGAGFMEASTNAAVVEVTGANAPRALNILHFCFGIGAVIGPLAFAALLRLTGKWWAGLLFVGASMLGVLAWTAFVELPGRVDLSEVKRASRHPTIRRLLVITGVMMFVYVALEFGFGQWAFAYMTQSLGASASVGSWAVAGFFLFLAIGRLITARLSRDFSVETILLGLISLALVAGSIIPFVRVAPAIVASCVLGLGFSGIFPLGLALGGRAAPGSAKVMGALVAAGGMGAVVSPPLMGRVADSAGLKAAMLVIPIGCVMILGCVLALPRAAKGAAVEPIEPVDDEFIGGVTDDLDPDRPGALKL